MAGQRLTGVSNAKTPKLNTLNKDPVSQSILSLLTPEDNKEKTKTGGANANKDQISKATLERISRITSTTIDANHELMESVPGAFKALSILQAAILSPRDLTSINLAYNSEAYEGRNNDLNNSMLNTVKDYVENNYKITDRLQDMVADILFYKGSRPIALLSSSALDNIINGHVRASMEALGDEYRDGKFINRGWIGDNDHILAQGARRASLESLIAGDMPGMTSDVVGTEDIGISVTDNDSILRLPQLKLALARNAMATKVRVPRGLSQSPRRSFGIEALDSKGKSKQKDGSDGERSISKQLSSEQYVDIYNQLFKTRDYAPTDLVEVRRDDELTKKNVDAVLWIDLPPESVIPVHLPGNPKARIGAYVLLDNDGNPLSTALSENAYQDNQQNAADTANAIDGTKGIIAMANEYRNGSTDNFSMVEFRRKVNEEIERDLVQRVVNGTFGQKVSLGMTDEIKHMMVARTLRNLKTKILFLPEESLVYMAFDYNRFGIGRSLLERSRLYASMAMANVIATTMANISASTSITTLGIQLDPDNPEPDATVEAIVTTHLNSNRTMSSLIGARNPRDVINIMDEASVQVKTSGHPGYPDIDVEATYDKRNVTPPDSDWNDRLLEMLHNMWGVDPALLSTQNATQFAIEHINNNALFRKSTGMQRHMLCAFLSELVQKIVAKSGNLMTKLYEIINENKKLWQPSSKKGKEQLKELKEEHPEIENSDESLANFILVNFINSIKLTLPEPMEGDVDEQNRAYDTMRQRYENTIKDLFTDDILSYMLEGADTSKFEMWRQNLVAHKMREWMAGSGSYADITALCEVGDDSNEAFTLLTSMVAYNEQTTKGLIEYLKLSNKMKGKLKEAFDKLEANGDMENNPADNGFGGGEEGDMGDDAQGFDGEGDMSGDGDFGDGGTGDDLGGEGDATGDPSGEGGDADFSDGSADATGEATDGAEASLMSEDGSDPMAEGEGAEADAVTEGVDGEPAVEDDAGEPTPELDENGEPVAEAEGSDDFTAEGGEPTEDGTEPDSDAPDVEADSFSEAPTDGADDFAEASADGADGEFAEASPDGADHDFEEPAADDTTEAVEGDNAETVTEDVETDGDAAEATDDDAPPADDEDVGDDTTPEADATEEDVTTEDEVGVEADVEADAVEEETTPEADTTEETDGEPDEDFTEPAADSAEDDFVEPAVDGAEDNFAEPSADGVEDDFEDASDAADDLDFEEPKGDDKPTGKNRKSKRTQKKEAKEKKESEKNSNDDVDFTDV